MIKLRTRWLDVEAEKPIVVLHEEDAKDLGVNPLDRVNLRFRNLSVNCILNTTTRFVREGEVGLYQDLQEMGIVPNAMVEVRPIPKPESTAFIKKKLEGKELKRSEINAIIDDIVEGNLSDIELGAYVSGAYVHDFTMQEVIAITERMIKHGDRFRWNRKQVLDKHSIGGVPGNTVTPIVVSVIAASGLLIPKTSSRAITSPSGTADTMEAFCNVSFTAAEIKKIVAKCGGCFVWGGAVNIAPADDKIIKAEYPLSLDPEGQVLASVMAKKKAMGSNTVVIDIPFGPGSKVEKLEKAESLAKKFKILGKHLGMKVECAITRGDQPIGNGIGPVLSSLDVLSVLQGHGPKDLREKACELAGILLKLAKKGDRKTAEEVIDSGRALKKFRQIVGAQGGNPDVQASDLEKMLGEHRQAFTAEKSGIVARIYNKQVTVIARHAGAPKDKGAGMKIHVHVGDHVRKGQVLFEVFAEKEHKLHEAISCAKESNPIELSMKRKILVEEL